MFKTIVLDNLNDKDLLNYFANIMDGGMKLSYTNYGAERKKLMFLPQQKITLIFLPCIYDLYKKVSVIHEQNFKNTNSIINRWYLNVHPQGMMVIYIEIM